MTRRYPAYKDSGVEWLGKVPEGWAVVRTRFVATFSSGGTPSRENLDFWGGDIPWVSPKDMKSVRINSAEESITERGLTESATSLLEVGTVMMVARSGILKHTIPTAINDVPVAINQDIKALHFDRRRILPAFFVYFVEGHNDQLLLLWSKQGATVESIEHQYLADSALPLPPLPEQTAIAAFLDRETAKIDALVAEQRRLIELLREKRQAVISHAVTRGLNPAVPLKPSGVDWLGDIPEGWEVVPLKRLSPAISVGIVVNPSEFVSEEGLPFIYGGDILEGRIKFESSRRISPEDSVRNSKTILNAGDLLTVRVGAPGITAVVTEECSGGNCASVMHIKKGEYPSEWLCYAMNSRSVRYQVEIVQYGAAQEQFNISHAVEFLVVTPPTEVAQEIADYLNETTKNLDALTAAAESAIALLQERRAALISAAVTGKIDVRDALSETTEAA